jgi:HlyD family secretion protein
MGADDRVDLPRRTRGAPRGFALRAGIPLALALLLGACNTPREAASDVAAAAPTIRGVRVAIVSEGDLIASRSASVTLRPARESRVAAGASGRAAALGARAGDAVDAGAPLVILDDTQARFALENATLALAQARIGLERAQRSAADATAQAAAAQSTASQNLALIVRQQTEAASLLTLGAVSPADVDALAAQRSQAESAVLQATEAVERAARAEQEDLALLTLQVRQAEVGLAQAEQALAETIVRAPFAGEVAETFVEVGEFVGAGTPVARLLGAGPAVASFSVSPEDAPLLEAAGVVNVRYAGLDLPATILRLERSAQQVRLVTVLAQLGADAPRIPPGALAEVRYEVALARGLRIPSGALVAEGGRTFVFVVDDGVARRREVAVIAETGNTAVVAAGAIGAGDAIIAPRPLDVREGTRVRVITE